MDILYLIKIIIVSIVEGITEFLPVSSTGHMIIVSDLLQIQNSAFMNNLFLIVVQLGAIMAVVVQYKSKLLGTFKEIKPGQKGFKFWVKIMIGVIPAGIIGLLFDDVIEEVMMNKYTVAGALIVGAIAMIICEKKFRNKDNTKSIDDISYFQAFAVGAFQTLAIIWPGFSRSASSIIGGWIMGLSTVVAAEFSFFLAIPTMFLGSIYKIMKYDQAITGVQYIYIIVGLIVAYLVAKIVIEKFIHYLQHHSMRPFAIYRIIVGLVVLASALFMR